MNTNAYSTSHQGEGRGELYDQRYRHEVHRLMWERVERPRLLSILGDLRSEGRESVLDFACGTGRITEVLESVFPKVVGVDISPDMTAVARKKCSRAEILCGDFLAGSIDAPAADLVTSFRFFPNADAPLREQAMAKLAERLNPDGRLLVNNHFHTGSVVGRVRGLLRRRGVGFMTDDEMTSLFERHGLELESRSGLQYLPLWRDSDPFPAGARASVESWLSSRTTSPAWAMNVFYLARRR